MYIYIYIGLTRSIYRSNNSSTARRALKVSRRPRRFFFDSFFFFFQLLNYQQLESRNVNVPVSNPNTPSPCVLVRPPRAQSVATPRLFLVFSFYTIRD